jgi:excinuclease ABC subunit B
VEIIRDLRLGTFDVVGINLLREGLDMPECRWWRSLMRQGRLPAFRALADPDHRPCARNLNGRAILYADNITGSMERAIGETERRRDKQIAFNEANGIVPKGVVKDITDIMEGATVPGARSKKQGHGQGAEKCPLRGRTASPGEITKRIKQWKRKMQLARDLEFEAAAQMRDEIASCASG